jgi:hypothetical protein
VRWCARVLVPVAAMAVIKVFAKGSLNTLITKK